jgi:hypothetical protein
VQVKADKVGSRGAVVLRAATPAEKRHDQRDGAGQSSDFANLLPVSSNPRPR